MKTLKVVKQKSCFFKNHDFELTFYTEIIPYNFKGTSAFGLKAHKQQLDEEIYCDQPSLAEGLKQG